MNYIFSLIDNPIHSSYYYVTTANVAMYLSHVYKMTRTTGVFSAFIGLSIIYGMTGKCIDNIYNIKPNPYNYKHPNSTLIRPDLEYRPLTDFTPKGLYGE